MEEFKTFVLDNANYLYLGFGYTLKNEMLYKRFENYLNWSSEAYRHLK